MEEKLKESQQKWQGIQEKTLKFWKEAISNSQPFKIFEIFNELAKGMLQGWRDNQESVLNLWKGQNNMFGFMNDMPPKNQAGKMSEMFGTMEYP